MILFCFWGVFELFGKLRKSLFCFLFFLTTKKQFVGGVECKQKNHAGENVVLFKSSGKDITEMVSNAMEED